MESARDVYSKRRIIAVTKLQIVEWRNYKHMDWITIRRDDDKLYKFKEGDYKRLHLQDIEDMLLLLVQGKLTNLTIEERVESYQKKLNLTRPDTDGTLNDVRTALDDIMKRIRMKYLLQTYQKNVDKNRAGAMIQAIDKQLKNRRIMQSLEKFVVLRIILVILPEHLSDTQVFTMKMEILLEPTSNKLMWVSDVEPEAPEEAPQSLEQAPPSPNYVSGPEHPPSPDYVPGPKYPKYLVPPDDEVPIEDHPLPADASPTALSPGYVADSDPLKEDPADYPTDEGDDEEESSEDDDDEEEDEASKEDEEDEEHLASTDSTTLPAIDLVPSAEDTEAFETDESAPTPPPSLLSPISSLLPRIPSPPTHTSPTYAEALMGYKVAMV
ncbi:hypothetical protein Tco_0930951 [Tanacetum coccineum]